MRFSNQATLSYGEMRISSNAVTGELLPGVAIYKRASLPSYTGDGRLQYTVVIVNSSAAAYTGLTLLDDFGRYLWQGFPRFPLAYTEDSAVLSYYTGTAVGSGTVTATPDTDGMSFVFDLPGSTTALLSYQVYVTSFASVAAGSEITNTVSLSGGGLSTTLTAQNTLPVLEGPELEISKSLRGEASAGQTLSYSLTVTNYGNKPADSGNNVIVSDQLSPPLENLRVYADGVLWTEGTQYFYEESSSYFQTALGAVQLPAAQFEQDSFGLWSTRPSSLAITLTGTVSGAAPAQALTELLPAYADGREAQLSAIRQKNDYYVLSGTGAVPAAFIVMTRPNAPTSLAAGSNIRFGLQNNVLTLNTAGLTAPVTAYIDVGGSFILRADYMP